MLAVKIDKGCDCESHKLGEMPMNKSKFINGKEFLPAIGEFFRKQRERINMKQDEAASYLKIQRSSIAKYESGERDMPTSRLTELCQIYQCTMKKCAEVVDAEIGYTKIAEDACKSKFMPMQYMAFATDTPMVQVTQEIVSEEEFADLVSSVKDYFAWERSGMRYEMSGTYRERNFEREQERRQNMAFFMAEFIKLNEPDKARRERLIKYCNLALDEHNKEQ